MPLGPLHTLWPGIEISIHTVDVGSRSRGRIRLSHSLGVTAFRLAKYIVRGVQRGHPYGVRGVLIVVTCGKSEVGGGMSK